VLLVVIGYRQKRRGLQNQGGRDPWAGGLFLSGRSRHPGAGPVGAVGPQGAPGPQGPPGDTSALAAQVSAFQATVSSLQTQLRNANSVLALAPYVIFNPDPEKGVIGPNITFTGANIHIVSGSNSTDDNINNGGSMTGRGNLIIGYDEPGDALISTDRQGSHNLVIGRYNRFTQATFGGFVAGQSNMINGAGATVAGGLVNVAGGRYSSVSGGQDNYAGADVATILGGSAVTADVAGSIRPQPPFVP
jgi:hypothetical protein